MSVSSIIDGFAREGAAQKDRLFLWAPVAFGAGAVLYFALDNEPQSWIAPSCMMAAAGLAAASYRRHRDSAARFAAMVALIGFALAAAGMACGQMAERRIGTPILEKGVGPVDVEATVESVERLGIKQGSRAVLTGLSIEGVPPDKTPRKVRLTFRKDEGLAPGMRIATLARIDPPSGAVLPGAYDFRRHLYFEGIGGVGFAYRAGTVLSQQDAGSGVLFFERLRTLIDARIHAATGAATGGIVSALITGERGAISEEDNDAMRESGLYHLLSISGTHVSMVAGVLFFVVRLSLAAWPWAALRWPIKKIAALAALAGAAFYVLLAGADVPAQRALLMTGLVLIAIMLDRSPFSLRLIAFAALVVLAIAPQAALGVSFQMSFAAVAALICFYEWSRMGWTRWRSRAGILRKCALYIAALVVTSLIAGAATGLFSLCHFQTFSLYGILSNMIAVPLTGIVIMPAAVASLIAMPFGLEAVPLRIMDWGVVWMLAIAHWTAGLDGATIHVRQWPEASFACIAGATILFLLWSGWRGKAFAIGILFVGIIIAVRAPMPDVLISQGGQLTGVTDAQGALYVSSGRKDKFTAENWMRLTGNGKERPKTFLDGSAPVTCDDDACRMEKGGAKISIVKTRAALAEDCAWADVVVSALPLTAKNCPGAARRVGLYETRRGGAQAVFFTGGDGADIRTAERLTQRRGWNTATASNIKR